MADLVLRDYQEAFADGIRRAWHWHRSVLGWLPTGGGKTEIAVKLAMDEQAAGGCTLFVVERKTLATQAQARFQGKYGLLTGVLRGDDTFVRGYEPVIVASIQTLRARREHAAVQEALQRVTLVVVDEAHIKFKHHDELLDALPNARVLGLTATPLRDGLGLIYDTLVRGPSYDDLIERQHLVPPRYFLPHIDRVADGLKHVTRAATGDFVINELSELMRNKAIIGDVVSTWKAKGEGRPTVVFCTDIAHSQAVCDEFNSEGIAAEHIDMRTSQDDRRAMFERFRRGETHVLCSIVVLGVGFDEPAASCAVLARPTLSLSMHVQQIGRVLRPCDGKADALVLDHAGNVLRHGRVEDFEPPELSSIDKSSDKAPRNQAKDFFPCGNCRALMSPGQRVCKECGHEIARVNNVHHLPGELREGVAAPTRPTRDDMRNLYLQLRHIGMARGYKDGWAWVQLKSRYDFNAPRAWMFDQPLMPTPETLRLVKSWQIAYRKAQQGAAGGRR